MATIILTKEQADKVRGRHGRYSALDPIAIEDGFFILPIEVLKDSEHKEVLSDLKLCKIEEVEKVIRIDASLPKDMQEIITWKTIKEVLPIEIIKTK